MSEIRLVAGLTFRDLLRRPGGWVATLLTAALFALLIGAVGLSNDKVNDRADNRSFKISMGGDLDGAARTIKQLENPRLVLQVSADPSTDVTRSQASAGIWFPEGTDRQLDAGESVELKLYSRASASISQEAFNTLAVRVQEVELQRLAASRGEQADTGGGPIVSVLELPRDERLNRITLARQLAPIAALLCIGIVTAVAAVLGAARERRSIEPLLVLPLERSSLAFGIAFGAYPLACLQIIVAVGLLILTAAIPGSSYHQSSATLVSMLVAGLASSFLLALVATGAGSMAGALGTGSDDAVSLGDLVSVLFVIVGVVAYTSPTIEGTWLYAVPILGQVLLVRDTVSGSFVPLDLALATISAGLTFWFLVRFSGQRLDDERRIARAIR